MISSRVKALIVISLLLCIFVCMSPGKVHAYYGMGLGSSVYGLSSMYGLGGLYGMSGLGGLGFYGGRGLYGLGGLGLYGGSGLYGLGGLYGSSGLGSLYGLSGLAGLGGMYGLGGLGLYGGLYGGLGMYGMSGLYGLSGLGSLYGLGGLGAMSGLTGLGGMYGLSGLSGLGGIYGLSGLSGLGLMGMMNPLLSLAGLSSGGGASSAPTAINPAPVVSAEQAGLWDGYWFSYLKTIAGPMSLNLVEDAATGILSGTCLMVNNKFIPVPVDVSGVNTGIGTFTLEGIYFDPLNLINYTIELTCVMNGPSSMSGDYFIHDSLFAKTSFGEFTLSLSTPYIPAPI